MALRHRRRVSPHNIFTGRRTGAPLLRPKLARDGADGVIDRSQDARYSESPSGLPQRSPSCLELALRTPSWQRSCATATTDRTYDRNRFDPYAAPNLASRGPSTYGTWLRNGHYPSPPIPVQRASRRPVIVPAGRLPRAARERVTKPPAGTAPTPPHGLPPVGVPW
jgi:hypothetical protein